MMVGWVLGDLAAWMLVHPRVRDESERIDVATIPALLGTHRDRQQRVAIVLAGIMTFVLLGVYAAAQLKAGSTALQTLFGWQPEVGAIIGAVIVVLYCFSGGIRASIWTDAAQSFVMMLAMATLLIAASLELGSPVDVWHNLREQDVDLVRWFPRDLRFGFAIYLIGMMCGGFGAIGQPHILVRFMAIRSVEEIPRARRIYFLWFVPFFLASIAVGLYARALYAGPPRNTSHARTYRVPGDGTGDARTSAPTLARRLNRFDLGGLVLRNNVDGRFTDSGLLRCHYAGH